MQPSLYKIFHRKLPFYKERNLKVAVFWDVAPCSLVDTNISEALTVSILRVTITNQQIS
jgi:hypothetical protein